MKRLALMLMGGLLLIANVALADGYGSPPSDGREPAPPPPPPHYYRPPPPPPPEYYEERERHRRHVKHQVLETLRHVYDIVGEWLH